jgi:uncharacterized protein YcfJ
MNPSSVGASEGEIVGEAEGEDDGRLVSNVVGAIELGTFVETALEG